MEETLFEFERDTDRAEIATLLRQVADNLEAGDPVTLSAGGETFTVEVPQRPEFEVKVERETESSGTELSIEFEMEWPEGAADGTDTSDASLSIE